MGKKSPLSIPSGPTLALATITTLSTLACGGPSFDRAATNAAVHVVANEKPCDQKTSPAPDLEGLVGKILPVNNNVLSNDGNNKNDGLAFRAAPNTKGPVLSRLAPGTPVLIVKVGNQDWACVATLTEEQVTDTTFMPLGYRKWIIKSDTNNELKTASYGWIAVRGQKPYLGRD